MRRFLLFSIFVLITGGLFAVDLTGVTDSTFKYSAGAGTAQDHSFGFEQYANLRLRIDARDMATFFTSFNLIASTGSFLPDPLTTHGSFNPYIYGENFAAALELERLYIRIMGEHIDTELGLLRMGFGYGKVWGSMDFLNPRNPLFPNARPRGVLGINSTYYPNNSLRLMGFVAAPKNPRLSSGDGYLPGLLMEQRWDKLRLQALYAFETPVRDAEIPGGGLRSAGIHQFGLSINYDLELNFILDAHYSLNPKDLNWINGLSLGFGFDYSFFDGDLLVLTEYLYNGSASVSAIGGFGSGYWSNNHYLFCSATYRLDDFTSISLANILCFDSFSFQPSATLSYIAFQGFTLNLTLSLPLDSTNFGGNRAGELGPEDLGSKFSLTAGARLRF